MYKPVDSKRSFPEMENEIIKFWEEKNIFKKSIENREGCEEFRFYDGPPFATGLPHFGHFVPGTIKDIIPRYKSMKGFKVERRFGWDCHGLPVEYEMEKELGISGKRAIEDFGVAEFNESCRSIVLRYTSEWQKTITRLGRWVDFENDYKTMQPDYMESIWWVFKQLWEKGLVYEGYYILPYCSRCSTVLSNHELNLGGYKDVHDPAITVKFKTEDNTFFLAWTTTPWTLPSNLALAVGADIEYVKIKDGDEFFILAKQRLSSYYKEESDYTIVDTFLGSSLEGKEYQPIFPYFEQQKENGAFKVFLADYVTVDNGTGIVHIAPGFGEDDYNVLKKTGIATVCPVDDEGQFTAEVADYFGRHVKACDKDIIARLKEEGKLVKRENYLHSYPHCWRCDSPLIYKAVSSWFVDISKVKQKMLDANNQINWVPSHLQSGRFGKWLENARDWAISRNRYWGNPIPVWRCDECGELECIGSRDELAQKSGATVTDLHKHYVDDLTFSCSKCNGTMKRVPEVLDCWFESGAMPYAQNHYPFENKEKFESHFPADFIAEGLDQTRGWFYTLTILAAALFDKPAFKNVVVNGLVLAEDGKKMSKSLRNYSDPNEIMEKFGADALRLFLIDSAVVRAEDLKFSDEGVKTILKSTILPLWNAYIFYVTYANIDNVRPNSAPVDPSNPLDAWIISEVEKLVGEVTEALDSYQLQKAISPINNFIDLLNNWYIRRSRRRFWKSGNDGDKQQAYQTLYYVLMSLVKTASPFMPFITEEIYQNFKSEDMPESIHLCNFPVEDPTKRDYDLEKKMSLAMKAVSMGRSLRATHNLKNRQPLKAIYLVTIDQEEKTILVQMEDLIKEELNVKEIVFADNEQDLVEYSAKANFKVLGRVLGKNMKLGAAEIEKLTSEEIQSIIEGNTLYLDVEGFGTLELNSESVDVRRSEKANLKVQNEGSLTIALDSEITEELKNEGITRDLIRTIQNFRKDSGFDVVDRIKISVVGNQEFTDAVKMFSSLVCDEVLAETINFEECTGCVDMESGEFSIKLNIAKV
ncbi:MAG: isoleucine--tRNA ligase [Spirochaetales bacterium]|nr:isoleucine--tRNA ligase [Spirochaetales bacterium]